MTGVRAAAIIYTAVLNGKTQSGGSVSRRNKTSECGGTTAVSIGINRFGKRMKYFPITACKY